MNYLIGEILVCLLLAGLIGTLLGWFLRGGCRKKLEHNSLDWQEKLRLDNLSCKKKILEVEEKYNHKLNEKEYEYTYKINQLISNERNNDSEYLQNEISKLKKKLALSESKRIKYEEDSKLTIDQLSFKRVKQENIFLKEEIERSVSELSSSEQLNNIKEREIESLNQKILRLKKQLVFNDKSWQLKLEERELDWVDKIALLEESSFLTPKN